MLRLAILSPHGAACSGYPTSRANLSLALRLAYKSLVEVCCGRAVLGATNYSMIHPELIDRASPWSRDAMALLAQSRVPSSYGGFQHQSAIMTSDLRHAYVGKRGKVAALLPNRPGMAAALIAPASGAAAAVPNPNCEVEELRRHLRDLDAKALVLPADEVGPARVSVDELRACCLDVHRKRDASAGCYVLAGYEPWTTRERDDLAWAEASRWYCMPSARQHAEHRPAVARQSVKIGVQCRARAAGF